MAIDFKAKDVIHKIAAKFTPAFLPEAKKPYYLKAVHQQEIDVHGIASKAELYNVAVPAKVIEDGLNAGIELIYYLAADGYTIKTSLFTLKIRLAGEYDGSETHLPEGIFPQARIQASAEFREYLKNKVRIEFDGNDSTDGLIAEAVDEATGLVDETVTIGSIVTIRGCGLKVEADGDRKEFTGVFFKPASGAPVKAELIVVNEPRTLKVLVPTDLVSGEAYRIEVVTQSSARTHSHILKEPRTMASDFTLTARQRSAGAH